MASLYVEQRWCGNTTSSNVLTCRKTTSSAIDWAFNLSLGYDRNSARETIWWLLEHYTDPVEILRKRQFTTLHQICLGLSQLDLKAQLGLTTSEVDVRDSTGRITLHWAVRFNNISAIKILLVYGAELCLLAEGETSVFRPLQSTSDKSTIALGILLGAFSQYETQAPRSIPLCPRSRSPGAYLERCKECDIDAIGKLINRPNKDHETPLMFNAFFNMASHTHLLLAHGAIIEGNNDPAGEFCPSDVYSLN